MLFREGARLFLSCVSEKETEVKVSGGGKTWCALRARCTGKWGVRYYDLTCFDDNAVLIGKAVKVAGLRMIAIGVPKEELYNGRIQYKMTVEELWVEDLEKKEFAEIISKNGVAEVEERAYEPIEVPLSIG